MHLASGCYLVADSDYRGYSGITRVEFVQSRAILEVGFCCLELINRLVHMSQTRSISGAIVGKFSLEKNPVVSCRRFYFFIKIKYL